MEKLPGEVLRLSPGNFSPPTFQTGRFPGENDVSPVKLPGEEFGLKGGIRLMELYTNFTKLSLFMKMHFPSTFILRYVRAKMTACI